MDHPDTLYPPTEPANTPVLVDAAIPVARRYVPPRPWSFWATMGWMLIVAVAYILAYVVVMIAMVLYLAATQSPEASHAFMRDPEEDGTFLCLGTIVAALLCTATILLIIRPTRLPVREYLALRQPRGRTWLLWLAIMTLVILVQELTYIFVGTEEDAAFMPTIYDSAATPVLVYLGIVLAAPLLEEVVFRGFMYTGFAISRIGVAGAILVPAVLWALLHIQYSPGVIGIIFGLGIVFGIARWWTGSLLIPLVLHAYQNLIATLQVAYDFTFFGWLLDAPA